MTAKRSPQEARLHAAAKVVNVEEVAGDRWRLTSPAPGWFRPAVHDGQLVDAAATGLAVGAVIGELEVLGKRYLLLAPRGAGAVRLPEALRDRARVAVSAGDELLSLDGSAALRAGEDQRGGSASAAQRGLVLRAPSSGRYYGRPGPQKPPFVSVGEVLERGQTVCLLEVMKTFHRVTYDDATLPERAEVVALLVTEDADVTAGQPLLEVAPVAR